MRSILVTGAGGFVGGHVVRVLRESIPEASIHPLSRSRSGATDGEVCFLALDHLDDLCELLARITPQAIVHCAGIASQDASLLERDNVMATRALLKAAERAAICTRMIHIGSAAEYAPLTAPESTSEESPETPVSTYGHSKLEATRLVVSRSSNLLDTAVLRLFNPVGIGMSEATLPGKLTRWFKETDERHISLGKLDDARDFIDIRDCAQAVVAALRYKGALNGAIFNIGTGHARPTRDLVAGIMARAPRFATFDETLGGSDRSKSVAWQQADITKAKRLLGWSPKFSFDEMLDTLMRS